MAQQHLNYGTLRLRTPAEPPVADDPITVIVTGVGRSGTSMAAAIISALGLPMGRTQNQAVCEDKEFIAALIHFDYILMQAQIDSRNAEAQRWGFKFPSLQNHMLVPQLGRFRNPHLIVITRDPVATAARAAISDPEQADAANAFFNVCQQAFDMMHFIQKAHCPTLLLSYEKVVGFPERAVDGIADFCGITPTQAARARALLAVEPNNPRYIKLFHQNHRGHFHGVSANQALGWCRVNDSNTPVSVELLADGKVVATAPANIFREDLKDAGIGDGRHSFAIDISGLDLRDDAILRVQTDDGDFTLEGSDNPLSRLRTDHPAGS